MNNILYDIFKEYEPILAIYENENEYICFPDTGKAESVAVYYDKDLKQYNLVFFYEKNTIFEDIENSKLIYGKDMSVSDDDEF